MAKKTASDEIVAEGKLNEVIMVYTRRPNGSLRIQQDYQFCPSMAEQHTAHLTDLNYLMDKYKPDELAQYLAARTSHRRELPSHDYSKELSMQDAMNYVVLTRKAFDSLNPQQKSFFRNHVEFMKYLDNPRNQEALIKLGILERKTINELNQTTAPSTATTPPKQEEQQSKP